MYTTSVPNIVLTLFPSGSSSSSSSSDGLDDLLRPPSFLRSLRCFSNGCIPKKIDTDEFNASMHSRYGYKGRDTTVTQKDFKILEDFHNYIDDSCKWMTERWIDELRPLQKGSYR